MFKLIRNLFMLAVIVAVVTVVIILVSPHDTNNYLAAARDKHRLLYSVASPRIILVGGSNVAFSIDSAKISERFGMPVINMGLHANLGLGYMLNEVAPALRSGDIVLIFPEYRHFDGSFLDGRPAVLGSTIKLCPECISGISTPAQMFNVIFGMLQTSEGDILRGIENTKPNKNKNKNIVYVYSRKAFNQNGDVVAHLNLNSTLKSNQHVGVVNSPSPNSAIGLLNAFYQSRVTNDIRIFFMFPGIPINEYKAQKKNFAALEDVIRAELEIPILGAPQDFLYPRDFFFNTVYHMNRIGREARTEDIIKLLIPEFEK